MQETKRLYFEKNVDIDGVDLYEILTRSWSANLDLLTNFGSIAGKTVLMIIVIHHYMKISSRSSVCTVGIAVTLTNHFAVENDFGQ